MNIIKLYVNEEDEERLDLFLSNNLDKISRTRIQKMIKNGLVLVNGNEEKARYLVKENDLVEVTIPQPKIIKILPEDIDLEILYEDEDIAIVNKAQGMIVHPDTKQYTGTLVNALLYHIDKLSTFNEIIRPGIVHRLDRDTSGLIIIAKNNFSHKFLAEKLKQRDIERTYIALVHGVVKNDFDTINEPIGRDVRDRKKMAVTHINSKEAITRYKVLERFDKYTLIEAQLETGRTHQIRVHFAHLNHPIVGDYYYSNQKNDFNISKQLLHAIKLGFIHPKTGEYMEFSTEMPKRFMAIIDKLY